MVNVIPESDRTIYQCAACGMRYAERDWAEQCEAWCREHGTCNVEIIRHAQDAQRLVGHAVRPAPGAGPAGSPTP